MIVCGIVLAAVAGIWLLFRSRLPDVFQKMLLVLIGAALIGLILGIYRNQHPLLMDGGVLKRNENGEGIYQEELILDAEGFLQKRSIQIDVPEQVLSKEKEEGYLKAAEQEIEEEFPGDNESINVIRGKVKIRDSYQGGKVAAEWNFDNYLIMDSDGNVIAETLPEEGELVGAEVNLKCGETGWCYRFYFMVFPYVLNEEERFFQELNNYMLDQKGKKETELLKLPDNIMDYKISWQEKKEYLSEKVMLLGVILAMLIPFSDHQKKQKELKERQRQLLMEYPDMVSKMALLLGAGMTLLGAWKRIASTYAGKREKHITKKMPVYEEMLITCHEIESGIGEERAYERFGERCGQRRYQKLGSILTQNLRKGSRGLVTLLETEAEESFEERKSIARKYGEEAGTKLLMPMMIMLGIIMLILVIPAVLSFQM